MTKKAFLPPPSGVEAARTAVLASRFSHDAINQRDEPETDAPETAPMVEPVAELVADVAEPGPAAVVEQDNTPVVGSTTRTPDGMNRKTYYLEQSTIDTLAQGVKAVRKALGPLGSRLTEWEVIGAIVIAGTAQPANVAETLRKHLLGEPSDTSHTHE